MFESVQEAIDFAKNKDDGGIPLFEWRAREIKGSDPVEYEDYVHVQIINKGDPKAIVDSVMRESYKKRWPEHWKAFTEGTEAPLEGIPLKEFPMLTPADISTCHRYHIRTVEDLANYPDVQLKNIGSRGTSLKQKAVKFLEYRKGPDIDALLKRISELEKKVGNDKGNMPKRAAGDRVSKPGDTGGEHKPRRKGRPPGSKNRSKKAK